jgi:hypothetical protein
MDYLVERAQSDNCDIISTSSLTLSTATTGANGILVSSNLAGTISSSGTSVTGTGTAFSSAFVVGDIIQATSSSGARRITAIGSNTSLTVDAAFTTTLSGSTYKLGGKYKNTLYYLYAISKANGLNPAIALFNRSSAAGQAFTTANLPAGYSEYRELPFSLYLDASSNIFKFFVAEGWPYAPVIMYQQDHRNYASAVLKLYSGIVTTTSAASPLSINCSGVVPLTASKVLLTCWKDNTDYRIVLLEPTNTGVTNCIDLIDTAYSTNSQVLAALGKGGARQFQIYSVTNTSNNISMIMCDGYLIDGVY